MKEHDESARNPGSCPVHKSKDAPKKPLPKNGGDALELTYGMSESGSEVKKG